MPKHFHENEFQQRTRELHIRIGRSRRRIDRRLRTVGDDARRLTDWRTYVTRYPGWSLAAALGAGLAASSAFRPAVLTRWLGRSLFVKIVAGIRQGLIAELTRIWTESNPHE